jgi:hypothetical protein
MEVYGPFFFHEKTVTGITYTDISQNYLVPQLQEKILFSNKMRHPHIATARSLLTYPTPLLFGWDVVGT